MKVYERMQTLLGCKMTTFEHQKASTWANR